MIMVIPTDNEHNTLLLLLIMMIIVIMITIIMIMIIVVVTIGPEAEEDRPGRHADRHRRSQDRQGLHYAIL